MEKSETSGRELSALRLARDEIKVKYCFVVTWDSEAVLDDGIKVVPV